VLATFIGRQCGSEWREQGLAEHVLEEVAKSWKRASGAVIVDGEGPELKEILKNLEGSISGGRIILGRGLSRQNSLLLGDLQDKQPNTGLGLRPDPLTREDSQSSMGMSNLDVDDEEDDENQDPRKWLKVIDAYEMPRLVYNVAKKHFDRSAIFFPFLFYYLIFLVETQQNLHYYLHRPTKHKYSETDTISSTSAY
jgi:DNA polymerase epsilon subunit 2